MQDKDDAMEIIGSYQCKFRRMNGNNLEIIGSISCENFFFRGQWMVMQWWSEGSFNVDKCERVVANDGWILEKTSVLYVVCMFKEDLWRHYC